MHQFNKHRRAAQTLKGIFDSPGHSVVVHYSCESFVDRPDGRSPRVTSIAVRNLETGRTESFSIHQVAERNHIPFSEISSNYDELEKTMLVEFYEFVKAHHTHRWLHWNMRDINYGFPALAHRARVLGAAPVDVPEERLVDLARLFVSLYGIGYTKHPRLVDLFALNDITTLSLLSGQEEAEAFERCEYVKLHLSTLRKVDNIASLVDRAAAGTLKTRSKWPDRHGLSPREVATFLKDHWLVSLLVLVVGLVASILGIFGVSVQDLRGK